MGAEAEPPSSILTGSPPPDTRGIPGTTVAVITSPRSPLASQRCLARDELDCIKMYEDLFRRWNRDRIAEIRGEFHPREFFFGFVIGMAVYSVLIIL